MKEILSLWGFGEVWGIFPGYVGKIIDTLLKVRLDVSGQIIIFHQPRSVPEIRGFPFQKATFQGEVV